MSRDDVEEFPNFGLSDDWLIAIGALIVQWSVFDWLLASHVRALLRQPQAEHYRPDHMQMGAARRLRLYRKLAPIFFAGEALKSARMAMKIANATKEDREWLAHGIGIQVHDGTLEVMRSDEMRTNERQTAHQAFTRDRLIAAASAIEEARICLLRAYASVRETLPPLHGPI